MPRGIIYTEQFDSGYTNDIAMNYGHNTLHKDKGGNYYRTEEQTKDDSKKKLDIDKLFNGCSSSYLIEIESEKL